MTIDPLFFELFKDLPSCFFRLIGRDEADARRYEMNAVELKSSSVRLDVIFRPRDLDAGPAYLRESQFYASDKLYATLLTQIGHGDSARRHKYWQSQLSVSRHTTQLLSSLYPLLASTDNRAFDP